jgi:flagellar basal body-associated protein FliL
MQYMLYDISLIIIMIKMMIIMMMIVTIIIMSFRSKNCQREEFGKVPYLEYG